VIVEIEKAGQDGLIQAARHLVIGAQQIEQR
jgi:hypothetical protein